MMMNFTADAKILISFCPELTGPTRRMPMGRVAVVGRPSAKSGELRV